MLNKSLFMRKSIQLGNVRMISGLILKAPQFLKRVLQNLQCHRLFQVIIMAKNRKVTIKIILMIYKKTKMYSNWVIMNNKRYFSLSNNPKKSRSPNKKLENTYCENHQKMRLVVKLKLKAQKIKH